MSETAPSRSPAFSRSKKISIVSVAPMGQSVPPGPSATDQKPPPAPPPPPPEPPPPKPPPDDDALFPIVPIDAIIPPKFGTGELEKRPGANPPPPVVLWPCQPLVPYHVGR